MTRSTRSVVAGERSRKWMTVQKLGNLIMSLSVLHPRSKNPDDTEAQILADELNADRRAIHRQREYVKCI